MSNTSFKLLKPRILIFKIYLILMPQIQSLPLPSVLFRPHMFLSPQIATPDLNHYHLLYCIGLLTNLNISAPLPKAYSHQSSHNTLAILCKKNSTSVLKTPYWLPCLHKISRTRRLFTSYFISLTVWLTLSYPCWFL